MEGNRNSHMNWSKYWTFYQVFCRMDKGILHQKKVIMPSQMEGTPLSPQNALPTWMQTELSMLQGRSGGCAPSTGSWISGEWQNDMYVALFITPLSPSPLRRSPSSALSLHIREVSLNHNNSSQVSCYLYQFFYYPESWAFEPLFLVGVLLFSLYHPWSEA